ncbi:MAG: aldehyde dehydrogenase family protein [Actinobacteria bacterium]|nr:aldehyde dehydrogenase family protein [Actinomycetota bacterium]
MLDAERRARLDADLGVLGSRAGDWAGLDVAEKRALLGELHRAVGKVAGEWARVACAAKGIPARSPLAGEEWISGPLGHLLYTTALGTTLDQLAAGRSPLAGQRVASAPGGRLRVRVRMPFEAYDRLLLNGFRGEVWLEPGITLEEASARAGLRTRYPDAGGVGLVLGAGNISSIAPLDALYKLYADGRVVMVKLNPVNDYLHDVLEQAYAPFVAAGFVRIVRGGADVGACLTGHPGVHEVHVTGSQATHDAIVFGTGREAARRKETAFPRLTKPITSELGGVAPVIVVPGEWTEADLRFQAGHVATQRLHNGGFNCNASQVVVVADGWPQKDDFIAHLREAIRSAPGRPAYYPGSDERQDRARAAHPGAERLDDRSRRTLILVDGDGDAEAFGTEYFAAVLAVTELPGGAEDPAGFLERAAAFANARLYGTLTANLIASPATVRKLGPRLDELIALLEYGTIGVNCWSGVGFLTPRASWGAYPGHPLTDIESGVGVVHNALLLAGTERTVVRGPFRPAPRSLLRGELALSPKPPWFVNNRTAHVTGRRLTAFAAEPRLRALPAIFASALRG